MTFTESNIEQAGLDWLKETLRVSSVNHNRVGQGGFANQNEGMPGKP
jgi:hypothetical protein